MPRGGQRLSQTQSGLRRPSQWRHRITPSRRVHQRVQRGGQTRVRHRRRPAATPRTTRPPWLQHLGTLQLRHRGGDRRTGHPRHPGHRRNATPTELPSFGTQQRPTLTLVQLRPQRVDPPAHRLQRYRLDRHPLRLSGRARFARLIYWRALPNRVTQRYTTTRDLTQAAGMPVERAADVEEAHRAAMQPLAP